MSVNTRKLALWINAGLIAAAPFALHAQPAPVVAEAVAVAPGKAIAAEAVKVTATVVGIDATSRVITLKGPQGKVFNVNAGDQVKNFNQIKLGDQVTAEFIQALSLELKKSKSSIREETDRDIAARAAPGAKPGGVIGRQVTILANVVAVDTKKQLVTLRGPQGNTIDLKVSDPAQLKAIKKGDQVQAVYTEALAIAVEAAPKAAAK